MPAVATDSPLILLHPSDNVAVARRTIPKGREIPLPAGSIARASAVIGSGHKVAVAEIAVGQAVRKFGQVIGQATAPIRPGDWVHSHNLAPAELRLDYAIASEVPPPPEPI